MPTAWMFAIGIMLGAPTGAAAPEVQPDMLTISDSHATRRIDCKGGDLAISGSDDQLTVTNCNVISVLGNGNHVTAHLMRTSTIATMGSHNHVLFEDEPGFDPQVTSTGRDNEIVPEMSARDMQPTPPIRKPPAVQ